MKRYMKNPCWKGYKPYGLKIKGGKKVPNCVPIEEENLHEISKKLKFKARVEREFRLQLPAPLGQRLAAKDYRREKYGAVKKPISEELKKENMQPDIEAETTTYHTELNPKLWTDKKLDSSVRTSLLKIAQVFLQELDLPLRVEDIILTGSNANYNWTQYSDLDLHIITDIKNIPEVALKHILTLIQTKRALWNSKHNITIKGYNVEVYVQQKNEILVATGVYSLMKDRWLTEPNMVSQSIDHPVIKAKSKHMMNDIDKAIETRNVEQIRAMIDKVAQLRKAGLQDKGEFSVENLVFKVLRNSGHIEKLRKQLVNVVDKTLTVEQYFSERVVETPKPKNTPITAQTTSGTYQGVPYAVKKDSMLARALTSGLGSRDAAVTLPRIFGPGFNVYTRGNLDARTLRHEIQGHGQQIIKKGDLGYLGDYATGTLQGIKRAAGQAVSQGLSSLGNRIKKVFVRRTEPEKPKPGPSRTSITRQLTNIVGKIHTLHPMEIDADTRAVAQESRSPAWQRSEGKDPEGGLNRKGIASYRRQNPGSKLSMAVTTKPSKLKKNSKSWRRRKSFCARMSGMKRRLTSKKTANDPNSRINKALRKWNC